MGQKRTYKQYSKEYKEEAVALVREQGYSVPEAAKSLGLASNMLYRWKEQIESQLEGKSLSVDEREELKRLRKENKNLRMEKEILKKAGAFFAREMKRARKGVFITTSRFSKDALEYIEMIEKKVVLIDGEKLASLMVEHNLGVATKETYRVKAIDTDFFDDV